MAVFLYTVSKINTSTQNTRQTVSMLCVFAVYIPISNRGPLFWVSSQSAFSFYELDQWLNFVLYRKLSIMFWTILAMLGHYVQSIQYDKVTYHNIWYKQASYWDLKIILNYFMRVKPSGRQILCSSDVSLNTIESELGLFTSVVSALYIVCSRGGPEPSPIVAPSLIRQCTLRLEYFM